ncbi:MAG: YcgL domain-containing protein [Pseudomonadota bacterium]
MQCWIYKGKKKQDHYLFVEAENDFSRVPATLLTLIGELVFVMTVDITPECRLATSNPVEVIKHIEANGYFLQLPPKEEAFLKPSSDKGTPIH